MNARTPAVYPMATCYSWLNSIVWVLPLHSNWVLHEDRVWLKFLIRISADWSNRRKPGVLFSFPDLETFQCHWVPRKNTTQPFGSSHSLEAIIVFQDVIPGFSSLGCEETHYMGLGGRGWRGQEHKVGQLGADLCWGLLFPRLCCFLYCTSGPSLSWTHPLLFSLSASSAPLHSGYFVGYLGRSTERWAGCIFQGTFTL